MTSYKNINGLAEFLFQKYFVEYLVQKKVNALAGSGPKVFFELRTGLAAAAKKAEIPESFMYDELMVNTLTAEQKDNLFILPQNVMKLADEMIRVSPFNPGFNKVVLHEQALSKAKINVCPMFPFC